MSRGPDDSTEIKYTTDEALDSLLRKTARASQLAFTSPLLPLGSVVAEKYVLEAQLGRGGMGAVYSARHRLTGKQFAIKCLLPDLTERPDAVQRFMREARVGGKFEHPNVVEVYDIGHHENCHYIIMELVQGDTLANRLQERGPLSVRETCRLLIPILRGVHAAHRAGVIHRDLKPHNIIISRDELGEDLPKVVDFGISKVLPQAEQTQNTETAEGTIIGTPEYMAPEQLRRMPLDTRVDVYASGVIAYQLLSGTLPFSAENRTDLVCKILGDPVVPLRTLAASVPSELAQVIDKAMARDPDARFSSVAELARALEPFAGGMKFSPVSTRDDLVDASQQAANKPTATRAQTESSGRTPFATAQQAVQRAERARGGRARRLAIAGLIAGLVLAALYLVRQRSSSSVAEHGPRSGSESHAVGAHGPAIAPGAERGAETQAVPAPGLPAGAQDAKNTVGTTGVERAAGSAPGQESARGSSGQPTSADKTAHTGAAQPLAADDHAQPTAANEASRAATTEAERANEPRVQPAANAPREKKAPSSPPQQDVAPRTPAAGSGRRKTTNTSPAQTPPPPAAVPINEPPARPKAPVFSPGDLLE